MAQQVSNSLSPRPSGNPVKTTLHWSPSSSVPSKNQSSGIEQLLSCFVWSTITYLSRETIPFVLAFCTLRSVDSILLCSRRRWITFGTWEGFSPTPTSRSSFASSQNSHRKRIRIRVQSRLATSVSSQNSWADELLLRVARSWLILRCGAIGSVVHSSCWIRIRVRSNRNHMHTSSECGSANFEMIS